MGHVYATLDEGKKFFTGSDYGDDRDDALLTLFESASRSVDGYVERGSQFGPVVETRTYYVKRNRRLQLQADVVSITSVTVNDAADALDPSTYELVGRVLTGPFWRWQKVVIEMVTGYPAEIVPTGASLAGALDDSSPTVTVDDATKLSLGMTLPVDDEQLQVLAIDLDSNTLTVLRGANGTTAASHTDATALSRYRYASEATDATIRVAQRRWKMRDAGITGSFDAPGIGTTFHQDTEASIFRATVGHLRYAIVG